MKNKQYDFIYTTHARLPTEKAHGVQITRSMDAFGKFSKNALLLLADQPNPILDDIYSYYGFSAGNFRLLKLPSLNFLRGTQVGYWIRSLSFSLFASFYILFHIPKYLYSREPFPLLFFTIFSISTTYEMHDFPESYHWFHSLLCRQVTNIVTTNSWAKNMCIERYSIDPNKIFVAPNGYSKDLFKVKNTEAITKKELGLSRDSTLIVYSGNLLKWKGVHILLEAAKRMPGVYFLVLGGDHKNQILLKKNFPENNIIWREHVPQTEVPKFLEAANILVLPNIPTIQHSKYSTSPIKLFEYMASGRPIVASDLPAIRSIVSEKYVTFCTPGSPENLTEKLLKVINEREIYDIKARKAQVFAKQFEWDERGKRIYNFISKNEPDKE